MLKYYFVRDAKMSLASHFLKHYVLSKSLGIPWSATTITRDTHGKPIYVAPDGSQPLQFNVTHQNGIVALAAVAEYDGPGPVDVGTDVVCTSERESRDHQMIKADGWAKFVDMHSDVFGTSETKDLKDLPPLTGESKDTINAHLRKFYALWCLREAYVKMTGEALLAEWLHELEFQGFKGPAAAVADAQAADDPEDTVIRHHEILFKGKRVDDANICLRSLGKDYMTCTAVRTPAKKEDALGWELGPFETIDIATIVRYASL